MMTNEIILYQSDDLPERIEVRMKDDTAWLSQQQKADLFGRGRSTITEHINNIFKKGGLIEKVVCREFRHTTPHGAIQGKSQTSIIELYNLDVIISAGYRVKTKQSSLIHI